MTIAMEALSSSILPPSFQQQRSPKRPTSIRINLSLSKTTHLAAVSRQVSGDADNDQQQHHNVFDFVPEASHSVLLKLLLSDYDIIRYLIYAFLNCVRMLV